MEQLKPQVLLPFSNPIFSYQIPYDDNFRSELINECTKYWHETPTINAAFSSRQVGWQSEKFLFTTKEPALKKVADFIINCLWTSGKSIAPAMDISQYNLKGHGWINVNEKGTLHFPHAHGGSTLSGAFYVKVPKPETRDSESTSKAGFIEFLDPRNDVTSFANGINELSQSFSLKNNLLIEPKEGTLLIFPAWLKHWVYPNNEDEERISISFNSGFVRSSNNSTIAS